MCGCMNPFSSPEVCSGIPALLPCTGLCIAPELMAWEVQGTNPMALGVCVCGEGAAGQGRGTEGEAHFKRGCQDFLSPLGPI